MKLLILKTNITSQDMVDLLRPLFHQSPLIYDWSVDLHDCDHVLRIEAREELREEALIYLVRKHGFFCEELQD